jgi:GNAT superfamily N-acetyltransferase
VTNEGPLADVILTEVQPGSAELNAVIALSKRYQATLGQLPYAAFTDVASAGGLLGAIVDGELGGYVLFARRGRWVAITQLCVAEELRGRSLGLQLVEETARRNPSSPGIRLRCRTDFAANDAWPSLGFMARGQRAGRSRAGHLLTDWWRPISDESLLTFRGLDLQRLPVAMDTNVFRDIAEPRVEFAESLALEDDWVEDLAELFVTSEVHNEIAGTDRELGLLTKLPRFRDLMSTPDEWQPLARLLRETLPGGSGVGAADLRHVAQSIAGQAQFLVTRDGPLLKLASEIEELHSLAVVSPAELLSRLHFSQNKEAYDPAVVASSNLQLRRGHSVPSKADFTRFCHEGASASTLLERVRSVLAKTDSGGEFHLLETGDGELVALTAFIVSGEKTAITVLRAGGGPRSYTIVRHLAHELRVRQLARGGGKVVVTDDLSDVVERALVNEGFVVGPGGAEAEVDPQIYTQTEPFLSIMGGLPAEAPLAAAVGRFELERWPAKVFVGEVPSYIVPVRPAFAKTLLGYEEPQLSLWERPDSLATARQHVYYRSPISTIRAPGRILWWVSGGPPRGGIRGVSWIDEVETRTPRILFERYGRGGVLTEQQIRTHAKVRSGWRDPAATAIRFSRTEVFDRPITLPQAKEIYPPIGRNGFLVSTRPVSERVFELFYREALPNE